MTSLRRRFALLPALGLVVLLTLPGCGESDQSTTPIEAPVGRPDSDVPSPSPSSPPRFSSDRNQIDRAVELVPTEIADDISPLLVEASEWPADRDLGPVVDGVEEIRIRNLVRMVGPLVAPELFPRQPETALGMKGRTVYLRLGDPTRGIYGQASLERAPEGLYTVSFRWTWKDGEDMNLDAALSRLASVSSKSVALELKAEGRLSQGHPTVNDPDGFQATRLLDRNSVGVMYPHVLIYANRTTLLAIYQQVWDNHDE